MFARRVFRKAKTPLNYLYRPNSGAGTEKRPDKLF
jgi:hypothetical protein